MKVSAGTWLGLVCCLLAVARCIGNPLSETHHPFAIESEETEEHLAQPIDSEEGQGSEEYAPPRLLQSHGPNNLQQSNEEKASERRLTVHEGREEDRQSNRTSDHHNISQGVTPNAEDLSAITVSSSSTNPQGHRNVISIIRNDTDSNLQVEIHGHSDSNRDQSSNLNFAPQEQQEELDSIVKRTVMPALLPEIQNGSLPLEIPNPETPGEGRPSQSDILHENNTNLEGQLMNEINTFQNATSSTTPSSVEALNSNRLLPDTDQDSVNIVEPGIETETNITKNNNATEGSNVDKHGGSNVATEAVPLATIQIPEEKPDTESSGFSNDTEENENAMSTTSRPQAITKENKYRTKGEIPEMTPDKDEYHPEVIEPYTFPQTPPTTKYFTFSRTLSNESTTQKSREEVVATTVSSRESGIRSTYSTRLPEPTKQIVRIRTTLPQERVPTERFLSTIISSSRFHSTSMISSEVIRETGTAPPPSERVPEVTIRFPTEAINPEPTEPIFKTTTRVNVVTESGTEGSGRTHYPDETVPQVTLRFPTEPMEVPLTTALTATETVDLNGKSSTQSESITEIIDDKITKGVPELNTTSSSNEEKFTVTILNMTRSGSEGVSTTSSNSESERTHSSTVNNFPDINSTLSSIQVSTGLSSPSHPTINYNTHTNSRTVSITSTAFSGSENSTNYDSPMTHYSTTGSTESYNTSDQRATIYTTGSSSASSTQQAAFSSTRESTKDNGEPLQHVTSAMMENITVNSMLETTPRVSGSTSQRQTTPPNVNITASQSTTPIRNSTFTTPTASARHNVTTGRPHVTSRPTTKKQRTNSPTTKKPTETPKATEKPNDVFTTALVFPPVYISMQFQWSLNGFCSIESTFIKDLTEIIRRKMNKKFEETQIKFINQLCSETATETRIDSVGKVDDLTIKIVTVYLYVTDDKGKIDAKLTVESSEFLRTGLKSQSRYDQKLLNVQLINLDNSRKDYQEKGLSSGMTIAVIIVIVGGICCVCLIVLQILMHKRNEKVSRNILPGSNRFSLRSLDSIALNAVPKSRPHSGFWNPGLDHSEENISSASNPLGFNSLSNMTRDMVEIYKEFEKLPNEMPSLSCVPMGAEDKNRFANVIPFSHSRVKLKKLPHEEHSDYINANFITGYNGDVHAYIATQAPLTNTITDFWRMIWEQQSRVIIMLMAVNETKQPRDPAYVPDTEGVNGRVRYGDIVLVLKKKEVRQEYIMSLLEVKDIENNLMREVRHFWFTSWPVDSIPEPISVIKLILDTRVHYEDSGAPLVVHCSSGTGRSGTMIAIDICMRSYESKRVVDILGCVSNMRRERAGLVQNKEQYALIYKTLNEYAVIMGSPRLAQSSSSAIQLQHML